MLPPLAGRVRGNWSCALMRDVNSDNDVAGRWIRARAMFRTALLLALFIAPPVIAQHAGHAMQSMPADSSIAMRRAAADQRTWFIARLWIIAISAGLFIIWMGYGRAQERRTRRAKQTSPDVTRSGDKDRGLPRQRRRH
jgi:hypothetical protein